jgi:hypothetical protein
MATPNVVAQEANPNFNLQQWLEMAASNDVDEIAIYEFLSPPLPANLVSRWLNRIQRIENAPKPDNASAAQWRGKISKAKGHAFERLIVAILKTVRFFKSWKNVTTTVNEIDILVEIGMGCQISPVLRQWGTHFICECKLVADSINATWIGKLNTVLETHNSNVGVLVAAKGPPRGKAKTQIHILTLMSPPRVIVCISRADLEACQNGGNFLRLITARYLEARTGATALVS